MFFCIHVYTEQVILGSASLCKSRTYLICVCEGNGAVQVCVDDSDKIESRIGIEYRASNVAHSSTSDDHDTSSRCLS